MINRHITWTPGILFVGFLTLGCTPPADLSTNSAAPDEYVVSVPGMH